ncbi:hypothetical protein NK8_84870 (plasmid) [Caballeronia sp. NK8]|uniref:radical SAM protein n=1 Tax=Caballeronia sp. NK8 TaxID=140098 RepID=UPI001BB7E0C4|nr:radical SAM protein [Caballeronia sp. NK8]BCQ30296.1 hypothetical protein NK8_84870 [Caballeronia sp. NK8]
MTHSLEPAIGPGRRYRDRLYTLSIIVTGRCNAACTYCHYYLSHDRKSYSYDISDELFETYLSFINLWKQEVGGILSYRFSGGDPAVLGDRLFELANIADRKTGIRPFVLTAGKKMDAEWVSKARASALSHVTVSIENPVRPDKGAPNPFKVVRSIARFDSVALPIIPGVCVVPNDCFKHLYEICRWFYEELGAIPSIAEANYGAYCSPTEQEWQELGDNLSRVIGDFLRKTPLSLFGSVAPELTFGGRDAYICDLDLENSYRMTSENVPSKVSQVLKRLTETNYPQLGCASSTCPWWESCENTKWYWQGDAKNPRDVKVSDYCRLKRLLSDAFVRCTVDAKYPKTTSTFYEGASSNKLQLKRIPVVSVRS